MKDRYLSSLSLLLYTVCAAALLCLIGADAMLFKASHTVKFITCIFIFLCGFSGSFLLCARYKTHGHKSRIMKITCSALFAVYLIIILDFTLIDDSFGRNISNFFALSAADRQGYIRENTNLIPFATVRLFINGYSGGNVSLMAFTENLAGNFFVFMPLAFFLPAVFKGVNTPLKFTASIAALVAVIELLQILFLTGSADIDDLILNTAGALLAFSVLKSKKVSAALSKLTYEVWI